EESATAKDGKWQVNLEPLKAGGPHTLTIKGNNTVAFRNVLVGEVWLASGQSNMEWSVEMRAGKDQVKAASRNPKLRLFKGSRAVAGTPQAQVAGQWVEAGPSTVENFSAVGYFFGRDLHKALEVPVGIIEAAWGGTVAEAWTPQKALLAKPELAYLVPNGGL